MKGTSEGKEIGGGVVPREEDHYVRREETGRGDRLLHDRKEEDVADPNLGPEARRA
jgi:hypothetical protein